MELQKELKDMKVDIAVITETKKKLKGSKELEDYIMLYSGVPGNKRASSGVAVLLRKEWKTRIHSYNFINDRIINVRIKVHRGYLTIVGIYAPEEGRKDESIEFYEHLQKHINSVRKTDYIAICGDFNARVGKTPIERILGTNGETILNENGKMLQNFAVFNEYKITNSFFRHKEIHKYTWAARGLKSIIDYILSNTKLSPHILDTRAYRGCDIYSDHYLLISKHP